MRRAIAAAIPFLLFASLSHAYDERYPSTYPTYAAAKAAKPVARGKRAAAKAVVSETTGATGPGCASSGPTNERKYLTARASAVLARLESALGPQRLASTCRPGARMTYSRDYRSYHATGDAFDVAARPEQKWQVAGWLKRHCPGLTMTYTRGDLRNVVHCDVGAWKAYRTALHEWPYASAEADVADAVKPEPYAAAFARSVVPLPPDRPKALIAAQAEADARALRIEEARAYLVDTAATGGVMHRLGLEAVERRVKSLFDDAGKVAYALFQAKKAGEVDREGREQGIACLHPDFAVNLAAAVREARAAGLDDVAAFSACRPPRLGVGGFADKKRSLHAYGLAVDVRGIGRPCSREAKRWHAIAKKHGVLGVYGPCHGAEWNHMQAVNEKSIEPGHPLRAALASTKSGDWTRVWQVADRMMQPPAHRHRRYAALP